MKNFLLTPFLGFLLVLFLCSQAYSFSISVPEGAFEIKMSVYSNSTNYGQNSLPFDNNGQGTTDVNGDQLTNTYGIFTVTTIADENADPLWSYGNSEFLVGYFWGLSDDYGSYQNNDFDLRSIGGEINFFKSNTNLDFNAANPDPVGTGLTDANEPDWNKWNAFGDGELWLSAEFTPGIIDNDPTTTYRATLDSINSPFTGTGDGYLNVTGGSAKDTFDTNLYKDGADMKLNIKVTGESTDNGWNKADDPIYGNAVPEPSTLILFGLGLLGFAGLARKKFTNK